MSIFKNILSAFSDALFVNFKCIFCNTETVNESLVCDDCAKRLTPIVGALCNKCGALVDKSDNVCIYCFDKEYLFHEHRSCFIYDKLSATPVKLLKYEKKKYLSEPIARIMFAMNKKLFENVDIITFVPMTEERKDERGFNQGEEIAKCLSEIVNVPVIKLMEKTKATKHQADLNFKKRCENLKGSFAVSSDMKENIRGKNILVVDDVFTTGSTLSECARLLNRAKAKIVKSITFLKTDPFRKDESDNEYYFPF